MDSALVALGRCRRSPTPLNRISAVAARGAAAVALLLSRIAPPLPSRGVSPAMYTKETSLVKDWLPRAPPLPPTPRAAGGPRSPVRLRPDHRRAGVPRAPQRRPRQPRRL